MTRRATGCLKKVAPEKRFLAIFSCWMVLYGPKQCCMIRAYHCATLDTPLAYGRKKIDPRPPGAQKRAKKALLGPLTEKSECTAAKPPKLRSFWHQPISGTSFRSQATEFLPVAPGSKISLFLRYTHIAPIFWGQTDPTQWDLKSPIS